MIPGIFTRDESFTLEREGYFSLDDGRTVPFTIEQHDDVEREQTKKKAMEVMQDR